MQEIIEKWRKEFEEFGLYHEAFLSRAEIKNESPDYYNPPYENRIVDAAWAGFLLAKSRMPVIELDKDYGNGKMEASLVTQAITNAGYPYRIKE